MCEGIQDSLGFCIQNCRSLDSGFRIPIVRVSGFLEVYHGFQSQGFWIPQVKFSRRIQDSTNNNFQDSGFHKQKFPGVSESPKCGERKNSDEKHSGCRILKEYYWLFFLSCGIVRYAVQGDTYLPVFSSRRWLYHMMAFPFSGLTIKLLWWQFLARLHFQFSPLVHA